ncbi:class F sortase [Pedococcus sp. KACC 23699]|uniref:Class F sortase n=1 Tax=Pedococcus sp. KACC 23699 TaxID=3149228 RepID=A0AAU7JWC0_9MICO
MSDSSKFGGRRGSIAAAVTVVLLVVGGFLVVKSFSGETPPPQPDAAQAAQDSPSSSTPQPSSSSPSTTTKPSSSASKPAPQASSDFGPIMTPSAPVALVIPSIGVNTKGIVDLRLGKNGELEAPTDFDKAGWYAGGPTPGEFGPSVIGAHVDSKAGPAVFYRLGALQKGASVSVLRKDGSTARFVVDRVARYAKADFPTSTVYGDTKGRAELRLITCGGAFDQSTGHYVDNIVAFAHLT